MPSVVTLQSYASVSNYGKSEAYFATGSNGDSLPTDWFSDTGASRFLLTELLHFYLLLALRNEPLDGKLLSISPDDGGEVAVAYYNNGRLDGPHLWLYLLIGLLNTKLGAQKLEFII